MAPLSGDFGDIPKCGCLERIRGHLGEQKICRLDFYQATARGLMWGAKFIQLLTEILRPDLFPSDKDWLVEFP